jgi:hypothetical protein
MLELSDPLWNKLDDAHRADDIPALLSELAVSWDHETAMSLLYDDLCHQETCYGATYAAIPHLLKIAEPEANRHQRREIAIFLGFVALCACEQSEGGALRGLPETLDGWDRKLDCYRGLVATLERPDRPYREHEQTKSLPRYREILAIHPVSAGDLEKILSIKAEFYSALPAIRALCERALLENLQEKGAIRYFLSGIAAADGLLGIARLLNDGDDGRFVCAFCGLAYEFIRFGERIAIYAEDATRTSREDKGLRDYREGAPSRADGFMTPIAENDILDARTTALLALAARAPNPEPALLVRHFAGTSLCCKCGVRGPIETV